MCQLLPKTDLHKKCQKAYKIIIKTVSCHYILRMFIQEYGKDFHAKNMADESKLQLSLLEMVKHTCY